ncbi:hypothetical protein D3C76_1167570 [compost metagenome]
MLHQVTLQLPLPRIGRLPLMSHPALHPLRPTVLTILDHAINPERRHLLLTASRGSLHRIDNATGKRRQETSGQQTQVRLIDHWPNGTALIKAEVRKKRPCAAVIAKH